MVHELKHAMLAHQSADDLARQRFVLAFKRQLTGRIRPGNRVIFEARVRPALESRLRSQAGADREEIKRGLRADPAWQAWAALTRCSQEISPSGAASSSRCSWDGNAGGASPVPPG